MKSFHEELGSNNVFLVKADCVIDCTNNDDSNEMIFEYCQKEKIPVILASYSGNTKVKVTYLDNSGSFDLKIFGQTKSVALTNSGAWVTKEYDIVKTLSNKIELNVTSDNIIFHMVEILK